MLAVIETHPVQYHAPVYRAVVRQGVPVTAIYGSDFSVAGYHDREFGASFAWDADLLSGYDARFLSRVADGGARDDGEVTTRGLRAALRDARPSAVLVVGYSPRFHRHAWIEAWRGGYPILFRGETSDTAHPPRPARDRLRRVALTWAYRSCARCLYIGRQSYEHLRRHGVADDRLVFSPYCVDTTPFETGDDARDRLRGPMRERLDIGPGDLAILYAGKLSDRKGVDLLVGAARALPDADRQRAVLVFLGDGERRRRLEAMAAEPPAVRARFPGFQNQRALSAYYHAADLLVLPSRHAETWGLVVNEALHHGVPALVSTRVGCAPDLIEPGRTGATFAAGDVNDLATAMLDVARLAGSEAARRACRERVSRYSVDAAAAGIVAAYGAAATAAGRAA